MKKDYVPALPDTSEEKEIAFIEQYWTDKWDQAGHWKEGWIKGLKSFHTFALVDQVLSGLPPGARVLDGGCGRGLFSVYYNRLGLKVTGLDICQGTINKLAETFPDMDFRHGDIRATGFPDQTFNAYVSLGTFEHFENGLSDCIEEAFRVLKPGGTLITTVPFNNLRHQLMDLRRLEKWDIYYDPETDGYGEQGLRFYQWRLSKSELHRELARYGFRVQEIVPTDKDVGLRRSLLHDLGLPNNSRRQNWAYKLLYPFIPSNLIGHMLVATATRPLTSQDATG